MKVLHLYKDYYPVLGGIENMIKWVAEAQVDAGHQVDVVVASLNSQPGTEIVNGVRVHKVPRFGTLASVPLTPTYPLAIRQRLADIVHIHSPFPPGELFGTLVSRAKYRVITYHSDVVRQKHILKLYAPMLKWVLKQSDVIMPTSANYVRTSTFLAPHADKCQVVPLGIEVDRFAKSEPLPLAKKLEDEFGPNILLFVGRLRYYKGLDTLLQAMTEVDDNVRLIIVGSGPLQADLKAQQKQLGLESRVHFADDVSDGDLPAYFQAADCFVLPSNSRAEAFGIVLLEAMASGLPCITSELGTGTSWVVQNGVNGLVVPPKTPSALAQAINKIFSQPALREEFAEASLARVQEKFSKEAMVHKIMQVYENLAQADS